MCDKPKAGIPDFLLEYDMLNPNTDDPPEGIAAEYKFILWKARSTLAGTDDPKDVAMLARLIKELRL